MNLVERFKTSWTLMKHCLNFLTNNKDLLWLPIISMTPIILILLALFTSVLAPFISLFIQDPSQLEWIANIILLFLILILLIFFPVYCNAALLFISTERLQGNTCSLKKGFEFSWKHKKNIFIWSLISAFVGLLLSLLERSNNLIQDVIVAALGISWALGSYFVLPILIYENVTPMQAFRQSVHYFKKKWRLTVGTLFLVNILMFAIFFFVIFLLTLTQKDSEALKYLVGVFFIFWFLFTAIIGTTFNTIVKSALYLKMVKQLSVDPFPVETLNKMLEVNKK